MLKPGVLWQILIILQHFGYSGDTRKEHTVLFLSSNEEIRKWKKIGQGLLQVAFSNLSKIWTPNIEIF
jgi:hypothetical protein